MVHVPPRELRQPPGQLEVEVHRIAKTLKARGKHWFPDGCAGALEGYTATTADPSSRRNVRKRKVRFGVLSPQWHWGVMLKSVPGGARITGLHAFVPMFIQRLIRTLHKTAHTMCSRDPDMHSPAAKTGSIPSLLRKGCAGGKGKLLLVPLAAVGPFGCCWSVTRHCEAVPS